MKRSSFLIMLIVVLLAIVGSCMAQRLPADVVPEHYDLTLEPDVQQNNFSGQETIVAVVQKPSATITLNAAGLTFDSVKIVSGKATLAPTVRTDETSQTVSFALPKPVPAGKIRIELRYHGLFNKLSGLYLTQKDKYRYSVTQFEPSDARRVFASFDDVTLRLTPVSWIAWDMAALDAQALGGRLAKTPGYLLPLD